MAKVVIDLDGRVDLNDNLLMRIADAWPMLRVLELSDRTAGFVPTTTFVRLFRFLVACREPEDMSICVNAQLRFMFEEVGDPRVHKLRRLNVCTTLIQEPDVSELATLFPLAFPRLCYLEYGYCGTFQQVMERRWDKVFTCIELIL
jgi:hypothetical protein